MLPRSIILNESQELEKQKKLGGGAFGTAYRYAYIGNNPDISLLTSTAAKRDQKYIVVKKYHGNIDKNELEIASALFQAHEKNPQSTRYCLALPVTNSSGEPIGLASSYISYTRIDKKIISGDLESAITKEITNKKNATENGMLFDMNLEQILPQITASMQKSVQSIHQAGVLHCDISARNFLVGKPVKENNDLINMPIVISDYGLSQRMPADINDGVPPINMAQVPIRWYDHECMQTQKITLATDLYATKAATIEMLGLILGKKSEDILCFKQGESLMDLAIAKRDNFSNDDGLKLFLDNVARAAEACPDFRKEAIQTFVECYKPYLTQMPSGQSLAERHANDSSLLETCQQKYNNILEQKYKNISFEPIKPDEIEPKSSRDSLEIERRQRSETTVGPLPEIKKNVTFAPEVKRQEQMKRMQSKAMLSRQKIDSSKPTHLSAEKKDEAKVLARQASRSMIIRKPQTEAQKNEAIVKKVMSDEKQKQESREKQEAPAPEQSDTIKRRI